jgi:hypothetical protein
MLKTVQKVEWLGDSSENPLNPDSGYSEAKAK